MQPALERRWAAIARGIFITVFAVLVFSLIGRAIFIQIERMPVPETEVSSPFNYTFDVDDILHEAGNPDESTSPYWWLDSGGELILESGIGKTMQGDAPKIAWRTRYALANSTDTDDGRHPQNLFRLLTRSHWDNAGAEISFRIRADNFSDSPNRNQSNGLLLMSRYRDGDNLYYAGIRVDGRAVIKKKYDGTYYTMAEEQVFPGDEYENGDKKNLLPHDEWIRLRSETITHDTAVTINLFMKREGEADWTKLLTATDQGQYENTPPITGAHPLGIRTDFMDVEFDNFKAENI